MPTSSSIALCRGSHMSVRDIFVKYGPAYLEAYRENMPANHKKVIQAIIDCRTENMGTIVGACEKCGSVHEFYCSCGNRHCPTCQSDKAHQWLEKQLGRLLPVNHFMITFTVPAAFRDLFRTHQHFAYSAFFKATSQVMQKLGSENTYFKGNIPGFFGVLHTWGRTLSYHPHIHYIVPGGAFDASDYSWNSSHTKFFLPVRVMSKLVKSKMFQALKREDLLHLLNEKAWQKDWNVNSQPVGNGERSVRYLAAYVFRTAISDKRILAMEKGSILFKYTDTRSGKNKIMKLQPFEFIRRFLQHVLPSGFMKIRYYGFLHPSSSIPLQAAVAILEALYDVKAHPKMEKDTRSALPRCEKCNARILFRRFISADKGRIRSGYT